MTTIDICICTFRRDHITQTLLSLGKLNLSTDWTVRAIVADNDDTPSAKEMVEQTATALNFPVNYLHAPARNISIARNACLNAATADFIAFLDDDEIATPQWLSELMETCKTENATAVLGPVKAIYPDNCPAWMRSGNFHATNPVWVNGEIITGYTCNLLLNRNAPQLKNLSFRADLGKTGGEDTVFLSHIHEHGGKIAFAQNAWLTEPVPTGRASLTWLMKRRFRSGQTHGLLLLEKQGNTTTTRTKNIAIALVKSAICFAMILPSCIKPPKMIGWLLRGTMHLGVVARLLGKKELVQYG